MGQKYISQLDSQNFMYPNNTQPEYDVKIIHDLIEGSPTGTISGLTLNQVGNNLVFNTNYTWNINGAEPFIDNNGKLNLINVYLQTPDKTYMAPWINVYVLQTTNTGTTSTGGTMNFTVTPQMVGQSYFSSGSYSINFQFISRRATNIDGFYYSGVTITGNTTPTPTPTPSITPTQTPGLTPTPTPTPTQSGGGSSYTYVGNGNKIVDGTGNCNSIGITPDIYLNSSDLSKYISNSGCLSDGVTTVSVIRNSDGTPISGTFYFTWIGSACSTTTFKSTNGNLTIAPYQC
jgi:hypothetical protein